MGNRTDELFLRAEAEVDEIREAPTGILSECLCIPPYRRAWHCPLPGHGDRLAAIQHRFEQITEDEASARADTDPEDR